MLVVTSLPYGCLQLHVPAAMPPCLHGTPQSRTPVVTWYCYEAGIPFEARPPRPSPHPFGQVPALTDDDGVEVFELGAILLYLADRYGGGDTPQQRASYTKWVVWADVELHDLSLGKGLAGGLLDQPCVTLDKLDDILGKSAWLLGDEFTVADAAVGGCLCYVPLFFPSVQMIRPNLTAYMARCAGRDTFAVAFGQDHQTCVLQRCGAWYPPTTSPHLHPCTPTQARLLESRSNSTSLHLHTQPS